MNGKIKKITKTDPTKYIDCCNTVDVVVFMFASYLLEKHCIIIWSINVTFEYHHFGGGKFIQLAVGFRNVSIIEGLRAICTCL